MGLKNTTTEYGPVAKGLHWLIALGILALLYLGIEQSGLESGDERDRLRFIHASIATITLGLMTFRIIWRWMNETPAHPDGVPPLQRLAASTVHWGLYIVVFTQLIAGAFIVGTGGKGLPVFGIFTVPLPIAENHDKHEWWEEVHEFAWKPIAILLILHIVGALYNHFIAKNDVLRRMTVGLK